MGGAFCRSDRQRYDRFVPFLLPGLALLLLANKLPDSVEFGELKTARDWAVAIDRGSK